MKTLILKTTKEFENILNFIKKRPKSIAIRKNAKLGTSIELDTYKIHYNSVPYFVKLAIQKTLMNSGYMTHEYINSIINYTDKNNAVWSIWIHTGSLKCENWMEIAIQEEPNYKEGLLNQKGNDGTFLCRNTG